MLISCDKAVSTAANELSRQWVVRQSTTHRLEIRRALYLLPSDKKFGRGADVGCVLSCDKAVSTAANELSRQWVVRPSTTHRLEIRRALYLLPSDKKGFLVISGHLRPLNHCPKWEIPQVCPICGNFLIETTSNPF